MSRSLIGTARVARLVVRRDRVRLPLWIIGLVGLVLVTAAAMSATYPDDEAIASYAALTTGNPALMVFAGPGYGLDDPTLGTILVNEIGMWGAIGVALMSIFLVIRHTRAEEDVERAELLRSGVLGRHALTAAAVAVVATANLLIAAASAVCFVAFGFPAVGSLALAGSFLAVGWVFVGVGAVAAQLAGSSRGALGIASGGLAVAFVLRAIGDVGDNWVRWLSPIGWGQGVRAFAGERWWPLMLCLLLAVALVAAAFWLSIRRDLGSGIIASRLGRAEASRSLRRPLGLTVRQHRGTVIGWGIGIFMFGFVYGSLGEDIEQAVEDNPIYADLFAQMEGASVADSFFATGMVMLATFAAGFTIAAVLRMRVEESAGRVEPILATSASRWRWAGGHVSVAATGTVIVMVAAGLGAGLGDLAVTGDGGRIVPLIGAALVTVPAIWVLGGLTAALFGLWPQGALAVWAMLALALVVALFGSLLRLPDWVRWISPFEHLPAVPAEPMSWIPVMVLSVVAAGLTVLGLRGFRRRDLLTS